MEPKPYSKFFEFQKVLQELAREYKDEVTPAEIGVILVAYGAYILHLHAIEEKSAIDTINQSVSKGKQGAEEARKYDANMQ